MIEFFKRLFKLKRKVFLIDDLNRKKEFTTYDYPESGMLILHFDGNNAVMLPIEKFIKDKDVYHLDTSLGLYILKYM